MRLHRVHMIGKLLNKFGNFFTDLSKSFFYWLCHILSTKHHVSQFGQKKVPSACVCLSGKFDMDKNHGQQNGGVKTLVSSLGSSFMPYGAPILSHVFEWEIFLSTEYCMYCDTAL